MRLAHVRATLAAFALTLGVVAAGPARADTPPSRWDRAKDPSLTDSYRVHVEVQRRLAQRDRFGTAEARALSARAMLERNNAEKSSDPRLRFDLGWLYLQILDYDKAAKTLASVLAEFPDHPSAEDGWMRLAQACGHTGDHDCERKAYGHVLRLQTEERERAVPTLNLAETEMHFGNLREAVDGYREALRIAGRGPTNETAPLAVWGMAVALDRSGDSVGGEKQARFARDLERSMGIPNLLRSDGLVFFSPSYEIHWYEGLGSIARAKEATKPADRVHYWRAAEQSFGHYVRFGELAKDRWIDLAKIRLATAKAEREKAEKKYGKEPRRESVDDEQEVR